MDFTSAVNMIIRDLEETRAIIDGITDASEASATGLDLARTRLHSASETLSLLPRLAQISYSKPEDNSLNNEKEVAEKSTVEKSAIEKDISEKPDLLSFETIEKQTFEIQDEACSCQDQTEEPVSENVEKVQTQSILADKFSQDSVLGENIISARPGNDIESMIGHKPVADITSAIGINDRFLFIRELFDNNSENYSKTINRLNRAGTLEEATGILDRSIMVNPNPEAYSSFTDILKRKFSL